MLFVLFIAHDNSRNGTNTKIVNNKTNNVDCKNGSKKSNGQQVEPKDVQLDEQLMNEKNEKNSFIKKATTCSRQSKASPVATIISRKPNISPLFGIGATKNISMHKFITNFSKGRALSSSTSSLATVGSTSQLSGSVSDQYQELRPPQFTRGDTRGPVRRGSISAESKIQEELKEMRAREEELRELR